MPNLSIQEIPIGSQLVSGIGANDTPDKNDFEILIISDENVTGLTESDITLSAGASVVSFDGANSVYRAIIRPPVTTGILTVSITSNVVDQGNSETRKDIRVTTFFPDADAAIPTELFTFTDALLGIATTPSRLLLATHIGGGNNQGVRLKKFSYAGVEQPSEEKSSPLSSIPRYFDKLDFINGDILIAPRVSGSGFARFRETETELEYVEDKIIFARSITHTRLGYTGFTGADVIVQSYDLDVGATTHALDTFARNRSNYAFSIAQQNDWIYLYKGYPFSDTFKGASVTLSEITASDEIEIIGHMNIKNTSIRNTTFQDIAIYRDTLYLVSRRTTGGGAVSTAGVYTLDIRPYRPIAKNTKTTIYPVFAAAGDTLDLTQFSPDAARIVFDVGYDKQPQLSINTSNALVVGSGAQTCLVKLKAINRMGATETGSFGFYLIVRQAAAPEWRTVSELTMRANSSYDLFQLVDADSIIFRSGRTQPTNSRISNGIFTIGTGGGTAEFTAQKGSAVSHIAIVIDVVQGSLGVDSAAVSGYRVEIAGIDVTSDLVAFPSVSETLDPVVINEYRVNEASLTLRNEGGQYNSDLAGNFWETNGLNPGGFQNAVKIYLQSLDGSENLHFSGVVNESFVPIQGATFKLNCSDISSRLRKARVQSFGTLEKWDALRKRSDEESYEGVYVPEGSLVPMQVGTGIARSDRTELTISRLALPSEGPPEANTGYMTPTELRTAGGFLAENPLLGFKGEHRSEDVRFLINQLATNKDIYNTEIDIPGVEVEDPFLLNRGSIALSVEQTRTTRLPVDWVYDATNDRILILLSNPERHLSDQLVQYTLSSDAYRVLHTFDKDVSVHRIARRSGTHYYILTSAKITQDRSAGGPLPRPSGGTGYAYDSAAVGSEIKIYHYNTATNILIEHVAANNAYPPQLGIHYWIGFENSLYTDEFEGIRPDYRGPFKWHSNTLYYRYAKDGEFGVARVDASGTTEGLMSETDLNFHNHLNFAFDINSSGTLYSAYVVSGAYGGIEIVATQPLGTGRGVTRDATLSENLSSYDIPLQIVVNLESASRFGVNDGHYVQIIGTDENGHPQTKTLSRTRSNGRHRIDGKFLTITTIRSGGFASAAINRFSVTTLGAEGSDLRIERRASDGTQTQVLRSSKSFEALTDLDEAGGVYLGVHEALFHNNFLYLLAPIGLMDLAESATRSDARPTFRITREDTGMTGERSVTGSTNLNPTSTRLAPGSVIPVRIDFDGTVSGATRDDVTITGGTLGTFSISSDMIDITIRPSETRFHKNITIHLARNAVDQGNEATHIVLDFGVENSRSRNRTKGAGMVLYRVSTNAGTPTLTVLEKWDFVQLGGCNLTLHNGEVYFVESPPASQMYKPYNPDI